MTLSFLFWGHFSFCGFELFSAVWVSLDFCGIVFFKWVLGFVLSSWGFILPLPLKGGRLARVDFYRRREDRNSLEWRA